MSKGFRTFQASQNTWDTHLYFPTPASFLQEWENNIRYSQSFFQNTAPQLRAELLLRIASFLESDKSVIQKIYCQESGLSVARFETEFARLTHTISLFATHIQKCSWEKQNELPTENKTLVKKRTSLGPVLVLGSSNFPLAYSTMGGDTVAALAAGCCVVVKAHPMHVGTSLAVASCIERAAQELQLPRAVFSHVLDNTFHWATTFAQHPQIKAIGFTGSIKGGRALMDLAAQRPSPIPVFAEMGSLNPVVICSDIDTHQIETIAQQLARSICTDAGQFCTKPGLLLVTQQHLDTFKNALLDALAAQVAVPMLHPDIFQKFEARKRQVFQIKGITKHQSSQNAAGILGRWGLAQTELKLLLKEATLLEEVFGPFAVLCPFENEAQLELLFDQITGQLTTSIFSKNAASINPTLTHFINEKVGRVILNSVPTGVSVVEAMHHGGAYPASSDARFTAVGTDSILRFTKEVSWQYHH
jgi:alpha-ketoglutaric semialdehyde dehydrogenase